jgi:CTP synthase (UTP-ammonia lyase)
MSAAAFNRIVNYHKNSTSLTITIIMKVVSDTKAIILFAVLLSLTKLYVVYPINAPNPPNIALIKIGFTFGAIKSLVFGRTIAGIKTNTAIQICSFFDISFFILLTFVGKLAANAYVYSVRE